ncbi:hypothetical protein Bca101_014110 [Brassica carinata]
MEPETGNHVLFTPPSPIRAPSRGWLKCNIGWYWIKKTHTLGCAWVVRDSKGMPVWHSRRSFVEIQNLREAKTQALSWALESMVAHRVEKLIVGIEDLVFSGILERPKAWPSFKVESTLLLDFLSNVTSWKVNLEVKETNKGVFLIAKSVLLLSLLFSRMKP